MHFRQRLTVFVLAACIVAVLTLQADAVTLFVVNGNGGAPARVDVNHCQYWTYSVSSGISDLVGGMFVLKDGSKTVEPIHFGVFEGVFADFGTAPTLLDVTLGADAVTQQFGSVVFRDDDAIALEAGKTYTAVLYSSAADVQNQAYLVKGSAEAPTFLIDDQVGLYATSESLMLAPPSIPEPATATAAAMTVAAIAGYLKRRRSSTRT
jgi:hypothetical protein